LEKYDLVEIIQGRDNSTLGGSASILSVEKDLNM